MRADDGGLCTYALDHVDEVNGRVDCSLSFATPE